MKKEDLWNTNNTYCWSLLLLKEPFEEGDEDIQLDISAALKSPRVFPTAEHRNSTQERRVTTPPRLPPASPAALPMFLEDVNNPPRGDTCSVMFRVCGGHDVRARHFDFERI